MPPRAEPGDRDRIEAALGPAHRKALADLCTTLGIPRARWQEIPALQLLFSTAAVIRRAAELEGSERQSLERAAISFGLPPDTVLNRIRRMGEVS